VHALPLASPHGAGGEDGAAWALFCRGQALHVIQHSKGCQAIFYAEGGYVLYRDWLAELAGKCGAQIHAWVFCKDSLAHGANNPRMLLNSKCKFSRAFNTALQLSSYRLVFVRSGRTSSDCSQTGFVIMGEKFWQ
jgi:hypothetical protein